MTAQAPAFTYTLDTGAHPPVYASEHAGAADLCLRDGQAHTFMPGDRATVMLDTGVHVAIPDGYLGYTSLRSSIGKAGFTMPNAPGLIDSDYRGPIKVLLRYEAPDPWRQRLARWADKHLPWRTWDPEHPRGAYTLHGGQRVVQMAVLPHLSGATKVDSLDTTARGDGGFGSTGTTAVTNEDPTRGTDK